MSNKPPALYVTLEATKDDPALENRGDRKLLVTEVYEGKEHPATEVDWTHKNSEGKCPVLLMPNTESAVFTEKAKQTRHYHKIGTEIYLVLEGKMKIEVDGTPYTLSPSDMIVVNPMARHEVKKEGHFLCRVITVNCGGPDDRHED